MKKIIYLLVFIFLVQISVFSITYVQAIKSAFENNLDIASMKKSINIADYSIKKTLSQYYPSIAFNGRYTRIGIIPEFEIPGMGSFKFGTPNNYDFKLTAQYLLYDWNRRENLKKMTENNKKIMENSYTMLKKRIAYTIANIFSSYNILLKTKDIFKSNLLVLKKHLDIVKKRYEEGIVSSYDLLSTKVQISKTESQIIDIDKGLKDMELSLKQILNNDKDVKIEGAVFLKPIELNIDSLLGIASSNREDLKNLMIEKSLITIQKSINKTNLLPVLSLQSNYELRNGMLPDVDKLKSNWNINFVVSYKIFDGFDTKYQSKILKEQERQNIYKITNLRRKIKTELEKSLNAMNSYNKSLQKELEKLRLAEETHKTVEKAYSEGAVSNIDVLNASANLKFAKLSVLKIKNQIIMEKIKILNIVGIKFWR